jgi:hypothetical protein
MRTLSELGDDRLADLFDDVPGATEQLLREAVALAHLPTQRRHDQRRRHLEPDNVLVGNDGRIQLVDSASPRHRPCVPRGARSSWCSIAGCSIEGTMSTMRVPAIHISSSLMAVACAGDGEQASRSGPTTEDDITRDTSEPVPTSGAVVIRSGGTLTAGGVSLRVPDLAGASA